jgi:SSS family solute:Na+ symporter
LLVALVLAYLAATVAIGLYAASRLSGAGDFAVAGSRFRSPIVAATVFATWFGAETVLGVPAAFMKDGLRGVVADPFAAMLCLVLVGLVFARPMHRLRGLTLGDYFRERFDRPTEVALSLVIAFSYIGWIAGQLVALGLVLSVLSGGAIATQAGVLLGAAVVLAYVATGGMWSVALTDAFQAFVIIAGMAWVAWVVAGLAGGVAPVIADSAAAGRFVFLPEPGAAPILAWVNAALLIVFGSVPQQDVLQRVKSARTESAAVAGSIAGGLVYFAVAAIPLFLVSAAAVIDPAGVARLLADDPQRILPMLILERTPLLVQALFFGALVSAILSTAAGALLAPAVVVAESVLKPWIRPRSDRSHLLLLRLTVAGLGLAVTAMALFSHRSIYELVNESGKVVLVAAFVPLAAGFFWTRATARGAHAAIVLGLAAWLGLEAVVPEGVVPPALAGLAASVLGMVVGSFATPPRAGPPV